MVRTGLRLLLPLAALLLAAAPARAQKTVSDKINPAAQDRALLAAHNPVLVIFPQDASRERPGAGVLGRPVTRGGRERSTRRFGDFHPISVEAFLDRGNLRPRKSGWEAWRAALTSVTGIGWKALAPTGSERAKRTIGSTDTAEHEIDLATVRAQRASKTWKALGDDLAAPRGERLDKPVTYGRVVPDGKGGKILQYYYLYMYNDFINNHEADWEMASVQLDASGEPVAMGLSSHHGGTRLDWKDVQKDRRGRPLAYVARGSHALYFAYAEKGHPIVSLKNLGIKGNLRRVVLTLSPGRRSRDMVPADPVTQGEAPAVERGQRLDVQVEELPSWARNYKGTWGGAAKIKPHFDGVGIKGPWATTDDRWQNPARWMETLRPAEEQPASWTTRARKAVSRKVRAVRELPSRVKRAFSGRTRGTARR